MKRPSFQFYPADWRKDPLLSTCSLAARGLWIELMCVAHESAEYGCLSINGKPMTMQQIARTVGETPVAVSKLIEELEQSGVFSRNEQCSIFSRRMVKDEHIRNVRADSGRLGGNPNLLNQKGKQKVKQNTEQILTPSSSSSSSYKEKRKSKEITLSEFLDQCKSNDEPAIRGDDPIFEWAKTVSLPGDMLDLGWIEFKNSQAADKKQADWRAVFRIYVKRDYLKLWSLNRDGEYYLTVRGKQLERELNGVPA